MAVGPNRNANPPRLSLKDHDPVCAGYRFLCYRLAVLPDLLPRSWVCQMIFHLGCVRPHIQLAGAFYSLLFFFTFLSQCVAKNSTFLFSNQLNVKMNSDLIKVGPLLFIFTEVLWSPSFAHRWCRQGQNRIAIIVVTIPCPCQGDDTSPAFRG